MARDRSPVSAEVDHERGGCGGAHPHLTIARGRVTGADAGLGIGHPTLAEPRTRPECLTMDAESLDVA